MLRIPIFMATAAVVVAAILSGAHAAVAAPAAGPSSVEAYPGDRAVVVSWQDQTPGASSYVATASDGTRSLSCTSATEAFCTITGLTNAVAYRVQVAARDASGTGPGTSAPGFTVPRGRCTPITPGPANPALAAAITARLATDAAFQAVFGAELTRLATCNPSIDNALRTGINDAVRAEPNGVVANALRQAIIKRQQVQAAIAADPSGPLARLIAAAMRIAAPVVTWPAWIRSPEGNHVADGVGATYGRGTGQLVTYTVEVHPALTAELGPLLAATDVAFGDARRSWPAAGQWQLRRVNDPAAARIRIILAPPDVTQRTCAAAGIVTNGDVSCWDGKRTNLNSDRWFNGGTEFTDVSAYRIYLINHEFGHGLGYGHVACSPLGSLAKVMQPQTLSLRGCRGNGWPYPNGA